MARRWSKAGSGDLGSATTALFSTLRAWVLRLERGARGSLNPSTTSRPMEGARVYRGLLDMLLRGAFLFAARLRVSVSHDVSMRAMRALGPSALTENELDALDDEALNELDALLGPSLAALFEARDVEALGDLYELGMGFEILALTAPAIALRPRRVWVTGAEILAIGPALRARYFRETLGLSRARADAAAKALEDVATPEEARARLAEIAPHEVGQAGAWVLQPGADRRRTGSHFTPRSLTEPMVYHALRPLLGAAPTADEILATSVCDPAMGGGAFLIEAGRQLATPLERARARDGGAERDRAMAARRSVAEHCLFGADVNEEVVAIARRALWLWVGDETLPIGFADASLIAGNSLVDAPTDVRATPVRWPALFPRVFGGEEPRRRGFSAVIGNPPFIGGKRISTVLGAPMSTWLARRFGSTKNVDLAAYFFRLAHEITHEDGVIAFVATNTIAQGATRRGGLEPILEGGALIYRAVRSMPWPGDATVSVAIVHIAKGAARDRAPPITLEDRSVPHINSYLRGMRERRSPRPLTANRELCFVGQFLRGAGFVLSDEEGRALRDRWPRSRAHIQPFLGGDEIANTPSQSPHRWVIDLGEGEPSDHPELLAIVEGRVKPERDRLRDDGADLVHKRAWWRFANTRPELRRRLRGLDRCIVTPRVCKHSLFAWQPTDRVFSDQLCVIVCDSASVFGVLQSRVHAAWAWLQSSTLGVGLRYSATDCFETFPFPGEAPTTPLAAVERAAVELEDARQHYLRAHDVGLATLHTRLDAAARSAELERIAKHWRALDERVLEAYGWADLARAEPGSEAFLTAVRSRLVDLAEARAGNRERRSAID